MTSLCQLSASALRRGYLRRELSPVDVLAAVAARLDETRRFNAFITSGLDAALNEARAAEKRYLSGEADAQLLLGIPIAVKDNYDTRNLRTTYGSSIFAGHVPRETAECVRRVEAAGAIVVGKTNLHEFAWGITGENPHFGPCRNPWDVARIAGGSSSGSAAAVALMVTPLALGSDTAGSIRIPASLCGILGFKPTYDRLPRDGLFPLAPSFDHVGLMAREPRDLAALFRAVDGRGDAVGRVEERAAGALHGVRVGVLPAALRWQLDADIAGAVAAAQEVASSLGADLVELETRVFADHLDVFAPIQQAEAFFVHHSRGLFPARAPEYGADVRARLRLGQSVTLAEYFTATAARDRLAAALRDVFETIDVLLTPVVADRTPTLAALPDRHVSAAFRQRMLPHTVLQSLAGIPSCVLRAGFDRDGMPIGVQLSTARGTDHRLLEIVDALYQSTPLIQDRWPAEEQAVRAEGCWPLS